MKKKYRKVLVTPAGLDQIAISILSGQNLAVSRSRRRHRRLADLLFLDLNTSVLDPASS